MAKPKFNYDGEDFYKEIYALAMQGLIDSEIAYSLGDNLGVAENEDGELTDSDIKGLSPEAFSRMKNGKYDGWTAEENERRSKRICQELAHGRAKILGIVRGRYLKAALGGIKVKGSVKRKRYNVIKGKADMDNMIMEETESVQETAPNMQALANWLYHNDVEFRNIQRGIEDDENDIKVKNGIAITAWIRRENEMKKQNKAAKE